MGAGPSPNAVVPFDFQVVPFGLSGMIRERAVDQAKREKKCGEPVSESGAPDQSGDRAVLQHYMPTIPDKQSQAESCFLFFPAITE
jgi:hypothetical protein